MPSWLCLLWVGWLCMQVGDVAGEPIESAVPAAVVAVTRSNGVEASLMECELRPASAIDECECDVSFHAGCAVGAQPRVSERESLGRNHFGVHTLQPVVDSFGRAHADLVLAAGPYLGFDGGHRESNRRVFPSLEMLGIGPRLEHHLARRVEETRDVQFRSSCRRRAESGAICACGHVASPFVGWS